MSRPEVIPVCEYCGSRVCLKWSEVKCRHTGQTRSGYVAPEPEPVPEPAPGEPESPAVEEPEPVPERPATRRGRR